MHNNFVLTLFLYLCASRSEGDGHYATNKINKYFLTALVNYPPYTCQT